MKKSTILFIIILFFHFQFLLNAQQDIFSKVLYDSIRGGIQVYSAALSYDDGYMIIGQLLSKGLILKLDLDGNIIWNKILNNDLITVNSITTSHDSCFVIAGDLYINGNYDAIYIKLDSEGNIIWSKTINHSSYSIKISSVQQTLDSGYVLTGFAYNIERQEQKVFIGKINVNGNHQWSKYITIANNINKGYSAKQNPDSSYIITGTIEDDPPFDSRAFLLKLSPDGTALWAKKYKFKAIYNGRWIGNDCINTTNGFLLYTSSTGGYITIIGTDKSGNVLWHKIYQGGFYYTKYADGNSMPKLHRTSDNAYVFVYGDDANGSTIIKIDTLGNSIWGKYLFLNAVDVLETKTKKFLIFGNGPMIAVKNTSYYLHQIGIIQTDSLDYSQQCTQLMDVTSLNDSIICLPITYNTEFGGVIEDTINFNYYSEKILTYNGCVNTTPGIKESVFNSTVSIYPNPTNGIFKVVLSDAKEGELIIFNCIGQIIYYSEINKGQCEIDLSNKPNGVYFYEILLSNNEIFTGKLIISD